MCIDTFPGLNLTLTLTLTLTLPLTLILPLTLTLTLTLSPTAGGEGGGGGGQGGEGGAAQEPLHLRRLSPGVRGLLLLHDAAAAVGALPGTAHGGGEDTA